MPNARSRGHSPSRSQSSLQRLDMVRVPVIRRMAISRSRHRNQPTLTIGIGPSTAPLCRERHGEAGKFSRNASKCPGEGFGDFQKNTVNIAARRCE